MRTDLTRTRKPHPDEGRKLGPPSRAPRPVGVLAPRPSGAFGVFGRPTPAQPLQGAQQQAARGVARARRAMPQPSVAVVPRLARPTATQRQAARELAIRSLAGQGIHTRAQVAALPVRDRQRANRLLGYTQTQRKYQEGALAVRQARMTPARRDRLQAALDEFRAERVGPVTAPTARALAAQGRQIAASHAVAARPGYHAPLRLGIGPAMVNIAPAGAAAARFLGAHTSLAAADSPTRLVGNTLKDALALGSSPLVGLLAAGNAGYQAGVHGDLRAARQLGAGAWQGIKQDALVQLATGHPGAAGRSFSAHPGFGLLDAAAGVGAAGRVGAAIARGAGSTVTETGLRGALARAGATSRAPLALSADAGAVRGGAVVDRTFSRGLAGKGFQAAVDHLRHPVTDKAGNIVTVERGGRQVPVLKTSERTRTRLLQRRANFVASRANSVERLARDQASHAMRVRGVRGRARDLVSMVVEGTITSAKHWRQDLTSERDRIGARVAAWEGGDSSVFRHKGEAKAAKARLKLVDEALGSERVAQAMPHLVGIGEDIGRTLNAQEKEAISLGILHPTRAARARLVVPAVAHMAARHFEASDVAQLAGPHFAAVKAAAKQARRAHRAARDEVRQAEDALKGAQAAVRVRRGQRRQKIMPLGTVKGGTRAARLARFMEAAANHPELDKLVRQEERDRRLVTAAKQRVKAARAQEKRAGVARKQAEELRGSLPKGISKQALAHGQLRHGDGRYLANAHVEDFLRSRGRDPESVAYLPHRLDVRGARAFHTQFRVAARSTIDKPGTRTGSAYLKGVTEASPELVREQAARLATQTAKAGQIDRAINSMGLKHPSGRLLTGKEAAELAQRLEHDTGEKWVPVSAHPGKLDKATAGAVQAMQDVQAMGSLHRDLLNQRVLGAKATGAKNVVLLPKDFVDRLDAHLQPTGDIGRMLQYVNRAFRFAVLPQPRWLTGNFVEPFLIRLPVEGSGLVNVPGMVADVVAATRIIRRMERSGDPKMRAAAQELRAQQLGALFVGGQRTVRRTAEDLPGALNRLGQLHRVVQGLPVVGQVAHLAKTFLLAPFKGFFALNRVIETTAQRAALGRLIRHDVQEFSGSFIETVRLGEKAAAEAARGLTNTRTQERFMREQHRILGKYEGFGPTTRKLVQTVMPFVPWTLAAARFVYWTMPTRHPVVTSLLVKSQQAVQKDWAAEHKDAPPGGLQAALRTKDGGFVDIGRYTPYGATQPPTAGDLGVLADTFLPQASGVLNAVHGKDPFGRDLQVPKTASSPQGKPTPGQQVGIIGNTLAESVVPGLAVARRLREGGSTPYSNSTVLHPKVKPGTSHGMSAARRTFDPFRPTYLKKGRGGAVATAPGTTAADIIRHAVSAQQSSPQDLSDQQLVRSVLAGG